MYTCTFLTNVRPSLAMDIRSSDEDSDVGNWNSEALKELLDDDDDDSHKPELPVPMSVLPTRGAKGRPIGIMKQPAASVSHDGPGSFARTMDILAESKNLEASAIESKKPSFPEHQLVSLEHCPEMSRFGPISMLNVGSHLQKKFQIAIATALRKRIDYADRIVAGMFNHLHTSRSVLAKFLETSASHVSTSLLEAGSATVHGGSWLAASVLCMVESMISSSKWKPIMMIRRVRYDETPTRIRLSKHVSKKDEFNTPSQGVLDPDTQTDLVEQAKILQSELQVSMLIQDLRTSEYILKTLMIPTTLQAVDRTTAENTKACIDSLVQRIPELRRISGTFPFLVHHATTDKFAANLKCEKAMKCQEPSYTLHHSYCAIHRLATSITAMNALCNIDTAGILSVSLACRDVGSAGKLRGILHEIFKAKLVIRPSFPSNKKELDDYRMQVYDLYLPLTGEGKFQNMKRRYILNHFMNGDLQVTDRIDHFCPFNHCVDENEVRWCFSTLVSWALIPTKAPKYSRGRWTGYDKATMWNGLLASHHSLLTDIIMKYTGTPQPCTSIVLQEEAARHVDSDSGDEDCWLGALQDVLGAETESTTANAAEGNAKDDQKGEHNLPENHTELPEVQGFDWVEFNRQQKAKAGNWVLSMPGPRIAIMHQVSQHFLAVMHHFLKISGDEFDRKQESSQQGGQRDYRVLDHAQGAAIKKCLDALVSHLDRLPKALPDVNHTRRYRNMFFCMTSRGACAAHQLVRLEHSTFPFKMFLALKEGWQAFATDPPCLYDELAFRFASHFSQAEHQPSSWAALQALATVCHVDVAKIECKHASNRDFVMLRGRGWTPSLQVVSAKFVCGSFRFKKLSAAERKKKGNQVQKTQKKIKRPGGAWRAFLSQRLKGVAVRETHGDFAVVTMQQLSREYKQLTQEEKSYFLEVGHLATIAGRAGHKPFGEKFKARPTVRDTLVPGETVSGAIVMTDGLEDLHLVRCADQSFVDAYRAFQKEVQALRPKVQPTGLGETDCPLITKMLDELGAFAHSKSFTHAGTSATPEGIPFHHVNWKPPVEEFAQAWGLGGMELDSRQSDNHIDS